MSRQIVIPSCGTWASILTLTVAVALTACGGPVAFADREPIKVAGTPPAPPPPAEKKPKRVEVTEDRIEINDKILFDFDKASIKPESHGLLDEIIQVIKEHPHIKKISIEGHTDSDGTDEYNQKLSEQRARSVARYLTRGGIPADMLTSNGFGETRPIADNDSDEGKEKNRRVEFIITEQEEVTKVFLEDPVTGKRTEVDEASQGGGL